MLHKNKITLYAFVLFLFGFILLTLSSILQAQTNAGEKVGDELTINGSRYWTGHYTDKQLGLLRDKLEFKRERLGKSLAEVLTNYHETHETQTEWNGEVDNALENTRVKLNEWLDIGDKDSGYESKRLNRIEEQLTTITNELEKWEIEEKATLRERIKMLEDRLDHIAPDGISP